MEAIQETQTDDSSHLLTIKAIETREYQNEANQYYSRVSIAEETRSFRGLNERVYFYNVDENAIIKFDVQKKDEEDGKYKSEYTLEINTNIFNSREIIDDWFLLKSVNSNLNNEIHLILHFLTKASYDNTVYSSHKKFDENYKIINDMYQDSYYPNSLVDKVANEINNVIKFLENGNHTYKEIQQKFDTMTVAINDLEDEFYEIETVARESIADAVYYILKWFDIEIDVEEAIRERDW